MENAGTGCEEVLQAGQRNQADSSGYRKDPRGGALLMSTVAMNRLRIILLVLPLLVGGLPNLPMRFGTWTAS